MTHPADDATKAPGTEPRQRSGRGLSRTTWAMSIVALVAVTVVATSWGMRPDRSLTLPSEGAAPVRGVLHVHSRLSDGSGTVEAIAADAARARLQFVIVTDHGDATRHPQPPRYIDGVLCIDAVEVTTYAGHVMAVGLSGRSPYPLGGEPRDVVEDIARLGGMSIAAHPSSPKDGLQWSDWDVPVDGFEWLNADSEWRDEAALPIARALFTYPWRPAETIATLLDRHEGLLAQWDTELRRRPLVALAGADAHASIPIGGRGNPFGDGRMLPLPGYESLFRTFSIVLPGVQLAGEAAVDAAAVVAAMRAGRVYSAVDALASPARFAFTATSKDARVEGGESLPADGPVTFQVRSNAPGDAAIVLLRDGEVVARARGANLDHEAPAGAGVYRVEMDLVPTRTARVPWIVSNAIRVGLPPVAPPEPATTRDRTAVYTDGPPVGGWAVEKNDASRGTLDVVPVAAGGSRLQFRFALGQVGEQGGYVAFVLQAGPQVAGSERLTFRARADKPMRVWIQLRPTGENPDYAWRRSVYLGTDAQTVSIPFAGMVPVPASAPSPPPLDQIDRLMFVVDGVHTSLGTSGTFWIDDIAYER